jgi:hypothetical protein
LSKKSKLLFLDPDKLQDVDPAEVLTEAAHAHLGLDHRFLHSLIDRPAESLPAVVAFGARDRSEDRVDLALELIALLRYWKAPEGVPFLLQFIKGEPEDVPDDVVYALVDQAPQALEPLLELYDELDESESGEVAFILANLGLRDERILKLLEERLDYDFSDTLLLLDMYGDAAAVPSIEKAASVLEDSDKELKQEVARTVATLRGEGEAEDRLEREPFDIWELYPQKDDPPVDLLDEDERLELLAHPVASVRAVAAHSFFNQGLSPEERVKLLSLAQKDESVEVRARAWESLIDATEEPAVVAAMLQALHNNALPLEERGGLVVGLAPETDRNEVRKAITDLYEVPEGRAKALEAMWRSIHPAFRDFFAPHLEDSDLEIRRAALWGVGYYGLKSELERVRKLFDDEELRSDALFSYALALPTEVSRGRMKGLLQRIEKDANGLSEIEEELVKAALDERLLLAGKEPVFRQQED